MPRVQLCEECGGSGARLYERGPAAERCPRCGGVGLRFADPTSAARDLRDLLTGSAAEPELLALGPGGALRALAAALALVEERVAATERELARRR